MNENTTLALMAERMDEARILVATGMAYVEALDYAKDRMTSARMDAERVWAQEALLRD